MATAVVYKFDTPLLQNGIRRGRTFSGRFRGSLSVVNSWPTSVSPKSGRAYEAFIATRSIPKRPRIHYARGLNPESIKASSDIAPSPVFPQTRPRTVTTTATSAIRNPSKTHLQQTRRTSTPKPSTTMGPALLARNDQEYLYMSDSCPDSNASDHSTIPTPECNTPHDVEATLASHGLSIHTIAIIRDKLVAIAKTAGTMMKNAHPAASKIDEKNNSADLVTATDKAIENMVSSRLAAAYPNISFLGEETFKSGTKLGDEPTFVCDPIDGTLNFTHGFPNCAVSLALVVEKSPVIGVVYNPFRDDLYTAVKSHGAYLTKADGTKIRLPIRGVPAPLPSLNKSLVAVEWGNERTGPNWALRTDVAMKLMTGKAEGGAMCQSIRSSGSAALDLCYVAAGAIDMFWEGGVWVWDVAAGICILREACGILASANPNDWNPTLEGRLYFAVRGAKPAEQENVVRELWALMGDRRFKFP